MPQGDTRSAVGNTLHDRPVSYRFENVHLGDLDPPIKGRSRSATIRQVHYNNPDQSSNPSYSCDCGKFSLESS